MSDLTIQAEARIRVPDMVDPTLGQRLRGRRKEIGKTLQQVASESGLTVGFISQIERGISTPSLASLYNVAKALETQDEATRRALYHQAQKIVASNFLQVLTYPQSTRLGVYKTAHGVRLEPSLSVTTPLAPLAVS